VFRTGHGRFDLLFQRRSSQYRKEKMKQKLGELGKTLWAAMKKSHCPLQRTREFLIVCSLPEVVAMYAAVRSTLHIDAPIWMTAFLPEGTSLPEGTKLLFWLNDNHGHVPNSLVDIWNMQFGIVLAASWMALVFCVLWRTKDGFVIVRSWIVLTTVGWILVAYWFVFVIHATWAPFAGLMTEWREESWLTHATWQHAVGLLWCVGVAVVVYRVWRRDRLVVAQAKIGGNRK